MVILWFQVLYLTRQVGEYLNESFRNRWLGRGGSVAWPPRSPDLTPLDYYLWDHVKTLAYETKVDSRAALGRRMFAAAEHTQNTYRTHTKHIQNTHRTHTEHTQNTYRTHTEHTQNTYRTHTEHIQNTHKTHTEHTQNHSDNIASANQSLLMRAENCIATGGGHFERLL